MKKIRILNSTRRMNNWLSHFFGDIRFFVKQITEMIVGEEARRSKFRRCLRVTMGVVLCITLISLAALWADYTSDFEVPILSTHPALEDIDLSIPVRPEPRRFKARSHMPRSSERAASGTLDTRSFLAKFDLVYVDDRRVWWESEHDKNDTEDDHMMHRAMEIPFRRLVELVDKEGGTLKVQDAYRAEGVHALRSLHREGRAIDLTCNELGLEKLAKLTWAAGFDWVYFEAPKRGGAHVHASVKSDLL